jgi:Na+-transporting methylmalonyl-CoA/oxaloacetate decarboxylase gamma subunit
MKKEPGVNGDWVPVSMQERVHAAAIPSFVTLGTPMLVQFQYAFSNGGGERGWLLPAVIWVYGVLFWTFSSGLDLVRSKRWEWTPEALEEKYRYWSNARRASRHFWGQWWVRFPIGLLFLAYGAHGMGSRDFATEWVSLILLMSAFVTPFVFVAELALLPLVIIAIFAYLALIVAIPISVIIMMSVLALLATVMMAMSRRDPKPPAPRKEEPPKDAAAETTAAPTAAAAPAAEAAAAEPASAEPASAEPAAAAEATPTAEPAAPTVTQPASAAASSEASPGIEPVSVPVSVPVTAPATPEPAK